MKLAPCVKALVVPLLNQLPTNVLGRQQKAHVHELLKPIWIPQIDSSLLALVWPNPGHCSYFRIELRVG